jgi:GT2 family glycosyltransferase/glycosyltransferase involved in cell wall biosynthesis
MIDARIAHSATLALDTRAVQLHVIHDLGGGSAKWLRDFARADSRRVNLVLRSITQTQAAGGGLALYRDPHDEAPLQVWRFTREIEGAVATHSEYRAVLEEIVRAHRVEVVLVSSFIGHSLDLLDTGLPTLVVQHDYFPYCPAINIHFDGVCRRCDDGRIAECHASNPRFNPFVTFVPSERALVRARFMERIHQPHVTLVTPSLSVQENLTRLNAHFARVAFATVPHGYDAPPRRIRGKEPSREERLRIVVLGQLSVGKGLELLRDALPQLTAFADVHLVGARELGEMFKFMPHVNVVSSYTPEELPIHIAGIDPHLGLLMSIVPETFGYGLTELMSLGVPVAATRVGSFVERISHGVDGYLYEPDAASLVSAVRAVDGDREGLARVRTALEAWLPRSAEEMVADYHRLAPVEERRLVAVAEAAPAALPADAAAQALTLADMWKDVKSLGLQLAIVNEARGREVAARRVETLEAEAHARRQQAALENAQQRLAERDATLRDLAGQAGQLSSQLERRMAQIDEIHRSTSWRISSPIRAVGHAVRKLRVLARSLAALAGDRRSLPSNLRSLQRAWRDGGLHQVKKTLVAFQPTEEYQDAWRRYHGTFRREIRPRVIEAVREMSSRPLISIVVATFDTPETMLRHMLDSVLDQLYPAWELCVVDDGSGEPHVKRVLQEYAKRDARIKLQFSERNVGVSHASNLALGIASGDFVVLLDHDDLLEEQALFRVAESLLADDPDLLYSDEVLVTADEEHVRRYAYRPAFSLEYLRSHPYIVHLVGFRTALLREIGGFDEQLRISQDYDLILRAAEKARTVVHVPEILYQWRQHNESAGTRRKEEVMEVSKALLRRHLERSGEHGVVQDAASFNLFDIRYSLAAGLKVAIIIPTKNHGDLLRQCIESLRATIHGVDYDIVVVDHESDDPATRQYLASLEPSIRVLHHVGLFNFSKINNAAVAQLADSGYSHYLFCNNDIEAMEDGWLERMLELGQHPSVGIVGAQLFYPDRRSIQHAGVCVGAYGAAEHYGKRLRYPEDPVEPGYAELLLLNHEVAAVTAACLLMRRDAFEEIGGFDEGIFVGFGDVDLCLRTGAVGLRVLYCPYARLVHHESYTRGSSAHDPHPEDSYYFRWKWHALLVAGDPFHNPGLSLTSSNWALRQPLHNSFAITRRVVKRDLSNGREHISFSPEPAA